MIETTLLLLISTYTFGANFSEVSCAAKAFGNKDRLGKLTLNTS